MPAPAAPFSWKDPVFRPLLERLQGNILKGHGRDHTQNVFFTIAGGKADAARAVLKMIATQYVTSALKQLSETEDFKEARALGEEKEFKSDPFVSVMLTEPGYRHLNVAAAGIPTDPLFVAGMQASGPALNDPAPSTWDPGFATRPDGMILIAATTPEEVDSLTARLLKLTAGVLDITCQQRGKAIRNAAGEGLEHFGYVDGRSQPLFLLEDIAHEEKAAGTNQWDPKFSPQRVIISDPGAVKRDGSPDGAAFGSYFVFRKLEEKVRAFKTREQELANELDLKDGARERAGALAIGRFEDGTPVALSPVALEPARGHVPNDFNYKNDPSGGKCPFFGHIRKVNPRGDTGEAFERTVIMARRGITYEDEPRIVHPDDLPEAKDFAEFNEKVAPLLPEGGVGLLFMAYNVDFGQQFEFTQSSWANSPGFPRTGTGIDPVIGQVVPGSPPPQLPAPQNWPKDWSSTSTVTKPFDMHGHVILRGGEYFFAPSVTFLRSL